MKREWNEWFWEMWCILSCIGIWPRYIEPRFLFTTRLSLPLSQLPLDLVGLKIAHFSDLHWNEGFSNDLKKKLIKKINDFKPDLIVFTGDFISRSKIQNPDGLKILLQSLKARLGCFAVLGNHDYARFVTVNAKGDYDVDKTSSSSNISKGFKRLFSNIRLTGHITQEAREVGDHEDLLRLLKETPFQVLHNTTQLVEHQGCFINICGVGDYTLGRFDPKKAFKNYDVNHPGIILTHNPDSFEVLKEYPGDIILAGHTHGGQINIPFVWKRLTRMENLNYKRGLKILGKKWGYVNRGISSIMKFRWFATPELTFITLQKENHE